MIVDEIHAIAGNKRGAHLALSLERLQALTGRALTRVGLSATQKPIEEVARFLIGTGGEGGSGAGRAGDAGRAGGADTGRCAIIDSGHVRSRDLALELPPAPLEAVMSGEVWTQVYDRLAELVREHRTTLVFVNTRGWPSGWHGICRSGWARKMSPRITAACPRSGGSMRSSD